MKTNKRTRLDAEVAARTALLERARLVLPTLAADARSDREVHEAVLHKLRPTVDMRGKSDLYVASYFNTVAPKPGTQRLEPLPEPAPKQDARDYVDDDDVAGILAGKLPASMGPRSQRLDAVDHADDVHGILAGKYYVPRTPRVYDPDWAQPLDSSTSAPRPAPPAPPPAAPQPRFDAGGTDDVHAILAGQHTTPHWPQRVYVAPPWTQPLASSKSKPRADASSSRAYRSPWRMPLASSKHK